MADVTDDLKEETQKKKKMKSKITHEDVLQEQYRALIAKQENLKIKKRKLELEVFLLEQRVCSIPAQVSINLSPYKINVKWRVLICAKFNVCFTREHLKIYSVLIMYNIAVRWHSLTIKARIQNEI